MSEIKFEDFMMTVPEYNQEFVMNLHESLLADGCILEIKQAKNGYVASYKFNKKTVLNWFFRKAGIFARIYGDNVVAYGDLISELPSEMQKKMISATDCKRLMNPTACSKTCKMGFVFDVDGQTYKKCRNMGMMFLLTDETKNEVKKLLTAEINVRKAS